MKKKKIFEYIIENELDIEKIVKDYSNYVLTIIKNTARINVEDTEEIISDVFVTLWNNKEKLDINKNISPYIAGITKNLIKKKYREIEETIHIEDFEEKLIFNENFTFSSEAKELDHLLIDELSKMKNEEQTIFSMYYFENKKIKDIARLLDFSEPKIKMKLNRTRKKLRKIIIERGM